MLKCFKKTISIFLFLLLSFSICSCGSDSAYIKLNIKQGDKFKISSVQEAKVTSNEKKYFDSYSSYKGNLKCISKDDNVVKSEFKMEDNKVKISDKKGEILRIDNTNIDNVKIYKAINRIDGIIESDKNWKFVAFNMNDDNVTKKVGNYINMDTYSKSLMNVINAYNNKTLVKGESYDLNKDMTNEYIDSIKVLGVDPGEMKLKYEVSDITSKYAVVNVSNKLKIDNITYKLNSKTTIDLKTGVPAKIEMDIILDNITIKDESKTGTAKIHGEIYIIKK